MQVTPRAYIYVIDELLGYIIANDARTVARVSSSLIMQHN